MQGDVQNCDLNVYMTGQNHDYEDPPFSKNHRAIDDFEKAKHETAIKECIGEVKAICIVYTNDSIMISRFKVLHDQNFKFDRGKNLCSFFGGPVATQTLPCIM